MPGELTLAELRQWEDAGAAWRAIEVGEADVSVELCTCTGEPVELRRGRAPELLDYVRARRSSEP